MEGMTIMIDLSVQIHSCGSNLSFRIRMVLQGQNL